MDLMLVLLQRNVRGGWKLSIPVSKLYQAINPDLERFLAKPPPMNMAVANCFPGVRLQPPPRDRRPGYV